MRKFPTRKSHTDGHRDRMSLLAHSSPPASPRTSLRVENTPHAVNASFDLRSTLPEKEILPADGAIQFVPAYEEAISPATTQPLSSPEASFSLDNEPNVFRHTVSKGHVTVTPSPKKTSTPRTKETEPPTPASNRSSTQQRKSSAGSNRIARLASLFSSRAIVKNMEQEQPAPSPPQSESSSAYVGWPGTQDKRGGTVAMEQSSYEESDHDSKQLRQNDDPSGSEANSAPQTEADKVHRMATPMRSPVKNLQEIYGHDGLGTSGLADPWGMNKMDDAASEFSAAYSKTSSAYFHHSDVQALRSRQLDVPYNANTVAAVMRPKSGEAQPPTAEALAINDHLLPQHPVFSNGAGYRGYLDKTRDVPNLMDDTESEVTQSSIVSTPNTASGRLVNATRNKQRRAAQDLDEQILEEASSEILDGNNMQRGPHGDDSGSDVFDGLSNAGASKNGYLKRTPSIPEDEQYTLGAAPRHDAPNLNLVLLGGGLTTIQTTADHFTNRQTASDFDENLTNSDYDQYGFAKIPALGKMVSAGNKANDCSLDGVATRLFSEPSAAAKRAIEKYKNKGEQGSDASGSSLFSDPYPAEAWGSNLPGGLQQYYVHPEEMKTLVKKFRKMSNRRSPNLSYDELEREEDATKVFALTEMRSRIMEKDIERGLERRGGTTVVDDLVLTPYNRAAMRVRDALVVAKAWRDGATPQDVVNTSLLTRRDERAYYILRPMNRRNNRLDNTRSPEHFQPQRYTWEEVSWLDDLELSTYRCHSIGPRHLRGAEMFTIGDCQSILLKLCNERCAELREALNEATARQIEAEDLMKEEEGDFGDGMTEAEMTYLTSMEEVKTISHKLVLAEKAFTLVRDRIEKLVAKYEALLIKFENDAESIAPSSVITADTYSDYTDFSMEERETLARRAQRAELRAELAAREANLTKQRARELQHEKEMEIQILEQRLNELQSESSAAIPEREHSVVLARAITAQKRTVGTTSPDAQVKTRSANSKIEDVKQKFRNRAAGRNKSQPNEAGPGLAYGPNRGNKGSDLRERDPAARERASLYRAVGEEMFQHLDFYERSLKAVETSR